MRTTGQVGCNFAKSMHPDFYELSIDARLPTMPTGALSASELCGVAALSKIALSYFKGNISHSDQSGGAEGFLALFHGKQIGSRNRGVVRCIDDSSPSY